MKQSVTQEKWQRRILMCVHALLAFSLSLFSFYFMQIFPNLIPNNKSIRNEIQLQNCYYIATEYKV